MGHTLPHNNNNVLFKRGVEHKVVDVDSTEYCSATRRGV